MRSAEKPKRKAKLMRRIVLGVGHPWYSTTETKGHGYTKLQLTKTPVPASILLRTGKEELVDFDIQDTGNWNKVRLVLEIIK